jgi:hypothetical protein
MGESRHQPPRIGQPSQPALVQDTMTSLFSPCSALFLASVWHSPREPVAAGRILEMMKRAHAATRRFLPTSPFKPPPAAPPVEQFAVQDQVTHDKYGLGRVMSVEDDTALVIDFGTQQVRITTPCAKLTKL